jgi:endonuclease/exonuclease/phosphatase family metal-dependent hydrolase
MGLRDDMIEKAMKFRHTLDKAYGGHHKANYIFLGDLNTMGMDYPFQKNIEPKFELQKWDKIGKKTFGMQRLRKTSEETWSSLSTSKLGKANLDHAYVAEHLKFTKFKNTANEEAEIDVRGWVNEKSDSEKDNWIKCYSDHSLLYFEVQKI